MTAIIGWTIIAVTFYLFGAALLWPVYRVMRRTFPAFRSLSWVYASAAAACGVAIWFVLPVAIHHFLGQKAP